MTENKNPPRASKELRNSARRIARGKDRNYCWDDLNKLHYSCIEVMMGSSQIAAVLRDQHICKHVSSPERYLQLGKLAVKEATEYSQKLEQIRSRHLGKTGGSRDPDAIVESLQIAEDYNNWLTSYSRVATPTVEEIMILANDALTKNPRPSLVEAQEEK